MDFSCRRSIRCGTPPLSGYPPRPRPAERKKHLCHSSTMHQDTSRPPAVRKELCMRREGGDLAAAPPGINISEIPNPHYVFPHLLSGVILISQPPRPRQALGPSASRTPPGGGQNKKRKRRNADSEFGPKGHFAI